MPGQSEVWTQFSHPFSSFPPLECHITPPLAVINGGPELANLDLDLISSTYHGQEGSETQPTKERLDLLCSIWDLTTNAKGIADDWGYNERRKRGKYDDVEHSQKTDRTTRFKYKIQTEL